MHLTKKIFLFLSLFFASGLLFADPVCVSKKTCVPVTINNQSEKQLYVLIHGSMTNQYFNFLQSKFDSSFNSSQNVKEIKKGKTTFYLPGDGITGGGRMYLSTGELTGIPDLATYPFIYDKVELGWSSQGTAGWNTTSVDFFGMPIQLIQGETQIGFKDSVTRTEIISELQKAMSQEPALYHSNFFFAPNSKILRIFSPQHFYTSLPNAWENTIREGINSLVTDNQEKGTGQYFKFNYGGTTYTDIKKLSDSSVSVDENGKTVVITGITTSLAAAGEIKPVGDQFAGLLAATINRGVLGDPSHWGQNGMPNKGTPQYYYQGSIGNYQYNTYAKILVKHAINSKLYATSYSDYWHMDSSLHVGASNNIPVTIKILPL